MNDVGTRPLAGVNYEWAEVWIRSMKLEKQLAPGTIRKRKGALSDVFDWVGRAHPMCLGASPLDQLPHGFSGYDEYTRQSFAEQGMDIPGDVKRNLRIGSDEERRIVDALQQRRETAESHERPVWLDYQLCRHNDAGEVRWTWRRTSAEMTQLYAELGEELARRRYGGVARMFQRIAYQPGFHGVRTQSAALLEFATNRGYEGDLPPHFFVQKVAHGRPLAIV